MVISYFLTISFKNFEDYLQVTFAITLKPLTTP